MGPGDAFMGPIDSGRGRAEVLGLGGSFNDAAQDRLRDRMRALTAGDRDRPIVAVGWNAERFDGRNLALRLVALGYTRVYWYRGGREAWEVNGQPETDLQSRTGEPRDCGGRRLPPCHPVTAGA